VQTKNLGRVSVSIALVLTASAFALGSQGAGRKTEKPAGIVPFSPESYVDLARIWKRRPVPVCWEDAARQHPTEVGWIESVVHESMEAKTAIRFLGIPGKKQRWPTCRPESLGIRLSIEDSRPNSQIGQQWQTMADGSKMERPTFTHLNIGTGIYAQACETRRKRCTEYLALHEFAHAIGFLHEHLRADASKKCKEFAGDEADDPGMRPMQVSLEFDPESITNYCRNIFDDPMPITKLSIYDVLAINHFYQ